MDAAEGVVEAERPARQRRAGRRSDRATALDPFIVAEGDEHVFALDAPISSERPFDAAAGCPGGDSVTARRGDEPVAAPDNGVLAGVDDGRPGRHESRAAFDIEQRAVP